MWPALSRFELLFRGRARGDSELVGSHVEVHLPEGPMEGRQYHCTIDQGEGGAVTPTCKALPRSRRCRYIPADEKATAGAETVGESESGRPLLERLTFQQWKPLTDDCTAFVTTRVMHTDDTFRQLKLVSMIYHNCKQTIKEFEKNTPLQKPVGLTAHQTPLERDQRVSAESNELPESFDLVYKGGNVMRFITDAFVAQHNDGATQLLNETYGEFFKPSDMDFGIVPKQYISPALVHKLSDRLSLMLKKIREGWMGGGDPANTAFPLLSKSPDDDIDALKKKLTARAAEMNLPIIIQRVAVLHGSSPRKGLMLPLFASPQRNDLKIEFTDENSYDVSKDRRVCESGVPNALYVSNNQSLYFKRLGDSPVHFDLVRMKLCVRVEGERTDTPEIKKRHIKFSKNLGGEVIDISVQHTVPGAAFTSHVNMALGDFTRIWPKIVDLSGKEVEPYVDYAFRAGTARCTEAFGEGCKELGFRSYTIPYLVLDIIRAIHHEFAFVWDADKYEKRIARLCGLLLVNGMAEEETRWDSLLKKFQELRLPPELDDGEKYERFFYSHDAVHASVRDKETINIYDLSRMYFKTYTTHRHPDEETERKRGETVDRWNSYIDSNVRIIEQIRASKGTPYKLSRLQ